MALDQPPSACVVWVDDMYCDILGSIIKFPPGGGGKAELPPYQELACSEEDRANIYELILTMAREGKMSLLFKQSHMKLLGAKICHVHPLKFLATIFTDLQLKECMREVFDDHFKKNGFMDGLGSSLAREAEKGSLESYLKDFAREVGVHVDSLKDMVQARDWEGFVRILIEAEYQEPSSPSGRH